MSPLFQQETVELTVVSGGLVAFSLLVLVLTPAIHRRIVLIGVSVPSPLITVLVLILILVLLSLLVPSHDLASRRLGSRLRLLR